MERSITVAGNIIVDYVKFIDNYPEKLSLVPIRAVKASLGGLAPNVGIALAKLDPTLKIRVIGRVGDDADGDFAKSTLKQYPNIDISRIKTEGKTAFTDVMTITSTGERTFFAYNGADGLLNADDFDFENMEPGLLHIGYILLLPGLDEPDEQYGTKMARVLHNAKQAGFTTSIDVVSEDSDRFAKKVPPSLLYADYCTINEFEAERTSGVKLRQNDGALIEENMETALNKIKDAGVTKFVTIHCPEGAFGIDENRKYYTAAAQKFEPGYIKSSVGAGDAFVAGLLYALTNNMEYDRALHFANTVAGMSLGGFEANDGILNSSEVCALMASRIK